MSTIREIARRAGVSVATVSKVLNGKNSASEQTAHVILDIAKELQYTPNIHAKNLKSGSSKTIGIITEDFTVFNTPDIVDGIDDYCSKHGYSYILGNLRLHKLFGSSCYDSPECAVLFNKMESVMLSRQVDGLIYVGCHSHNIMPLREHDKIPLICAYCFSNDDKIPSVIYDDRAAAYDVTKLLVKKGHTRIAMITGNPSSNHTHNRILGYQEALYDCSIPYDPHLVAYGDWGRDCGHALCGQLLARGTTAIFSQNDIMAMGVLDYCGENGIAVGKDLSLIGFDNREISTVCRPQLSTVALPLFEIGASSAEILIDILEKKEEAFSEHITLNCNIIERDSVADVTKLTPQQ